VISAELIAIPYPPDNGNEIFILEGQGDAGRGFEMLIAIKFSSAKLELITAEDA